jgi:sarcosine oxidase subunit beta
MKNYSGLSLLRNSLRRHQRWPRSWRDAEPRKSYDVVIVGAGGHGLATAYYLAAHHGIGKVAVLEKGWLGGGNSGRNTQVCRSNYFYPESAAFYDHSLQLYEALAEELNFNIMLSQRGVLELSHSVEELEMNRRWATAMTLNGIDSEILGRREVKKRVPMLNLDCRYPVVGGFIQHRGGIARHDAVVWAYARAASAHGVDLIQRCKVTGFDSSDSRVSSVRTSLGIISADRFVLCTAGHSSDLAARVGVRLPIESIALQAMVTESQSDRGEVVIGGGADPFNSYAQRGILPTVVDNAAATVELIPAFSRLRLMRQWAGICDMAPDSSPLVGRTPLENLFISTGWGTGGFKAIPAGGDTLASTVATGRTHQLLQPFSMRRFEQGQLVDEGAAAGVAH